jgi:NADH-quinone oxidoreductase subunit A
MTSTAIAAYLALFATVGFLFVFASLLLGRLLRANTPTPQKLEIYECGEPAVGLGTVQFDLRFYVAALVFLIFEVEVAMFFPTATVFGKAARLRDPSVQNVVSANQAERLEGTLTPATRQIYEELGVVNPQTPTPPTDMQSRDDSRKVSAPLSAMAIASQARTLAISSMLDLALFFAVLLVGFAYVWNRGDLDWVRAVHHPATPAETASLRARLRGDLRS